MPSNKMNYHAVITLPATLDSPIFAIGIVHGQIEWLNRLLEQLQKLSGWPDARLVFIDTSGGVREPLTACLLRDPTAEPMFIFSAI